MLCKPAPAFKNSSLNEKKRGRPADTKFINMEYSFIRENFNINSISDSILSVQVSPGGFSFVIDSQDNPDVPRYIYINETVPGTGDLRSELSLFTGFDLKEFHSIRIIVHNSIFALVPESLFDLQDMKAYLNLNHTGIQGRKAFSNKVSAAAAVSVFSVEEDLFRLLRLKFPGADFCHSSLPFCTNALNSKTDGCFLQVYSGSVEIAVVLKGKLVQYNVYEVQGENDIVYFVMNSYKSIGLNPLSHPLTVSGKLKDSSEALTVAHRYLKDIRFYKPGDYSVTGSFNAEYPAHYFLNHREILNCEL